MHYFGAKISLFESLLKYANRGIFLLGSSCPAHLLLSLTPGSFAFLAAELQARMAQTMESFPELIAVSRKISVSNWVTRQGCSIEGLLP